MKNNNRKTPERPLHFHRYKPISGFWSMLSGYPAFFVLFILFACFTHEKLETAGSINLSFTDTKRAKDLISKMKTKEKIARFDIYGGKEVAVKDGHDEALEYSEEKMSSMIGSVTTPVKALKGFTRISTMPGESKTVNSQIDEEALSRWNPEMKRVAQPGVFTLMTESVSDETRLSSQLRVIRQS